MMMPPSSATRFSLGRETEKHDDGDDLALFSEIELRETQNFLLQPSDELEDSFSTKLWQFSDIKHGISTQTSDMLNSDNDDDDDGDKNDYDWLLAPPDTPLFPSLDDEPPQVNDVIRGRSRSKPVSISRSSSMEQSIRSSRESGIGSRKPSPTPNKATTRPTARSSTPTAKRISTASTVSSGIRGATSCGNSASPRLRSWHTSTPGTAKSSRQSMSPTASRISRSFHSHYPNQFCGSQGKGSVTLSGDDDLVQLSSRKGGSFSSIKDSSFSKKSARMASSNSAPKRSFDYALRQMDKRNPQNMFRSLLSSVPSTTFYDGKAKSSQHSLVSRNSSVTTSSNASSEHGTSFALDTEGSEHNQDDGASETENIFYSDIHEEVFSFDQFDILDTNIGHEITYESVDFLHTETRGPNIAEGPIESEVSVSHGINTELNNISEISHVRSGISELSCFENTSNCSNCACHYETTDEAEKTVKFCLECRRENTVFSHITPQTPLAASENSSVISADFLAEEKPLAETDQPQIVPKLPQVTDVGDMGVPFDEQGTEENQTFSSELIHGHSQQSPLPSSLVEVDQSGVDYKKPDDHSGDHHQLCHSKDRPNFKADLLEGASISVLLKRSSSSKGPLVKGMTLTATTISYDDLSFTRDSMSSFRSSTGCGSYSASSSVDFGSARHSEFRGQRQVSGRKLDVDSGYDTRTKRPSSGSSVSETSNHSHHGLGSAVQETTLDNRECGIVVDKAEVPPEMQSSEDALTDIIEASSTVPIVVEEDKLESLDYSTMTDACVQSDDNSVALFPDHGDCISYDHVEDHPNDAISVSNTETLVKDPESSSDEKHDEKNTNVDGMDAVVTTKTPTNAESELKRENYCQHDTVVEDDDPSPVSKIALDDSQEQCVLNSSNDCATTSVSELNTSECNNSTDESTVKVECQGAGNTRSMTLEEATDTILFCSSIIHDLAYQAATIAMEKQPPEEMEKEMHLDDPLERYEPTVTILGDANSDREESHGRSAGRHTSKHKKAKPRPAVETDVKSACSDKTENGECVDHSMPRIVALPGKVDGMKPHDKLESKCNCIIM